MTQRVFLDVGAADGSSVRFFRNGCADARFFKIYCFEPLPENIELLEQVPNIIIVPKAVWSSNGMQRLYLGKNKSGTMFCDKTTGRVDPDSFLDVPTIDFAKYIKKYFNKADEIWLKMNVEGAEYEIVPHLHKNGLIDWFDRMYIRWHVHKIPSMKEKHEEVKAMVPTSKNVWRKKEMLPL